jgi:hypothetical protein
MGEMSWNQSLTRWSKLCMFLGEWFSWKVFLILWEIWVTKEIDSVRCDKGNRSESVVLSPVSST